MKTLYIDCTSGVCADMLLSGLRDLGVCDSAFGISEKLAELFEKESSGHHGLGYSDILEIFQELHAGTFVTHRAVKIYKTIAEAEAKVHGASLETVHFHEVGRLEAIENILRFAYMMTEIDPDRVVVSEIHDGNGKVECSHGVLDVPVPAVRAMMDACDLRFATDDGFDELVTPSGLGMIIGSGAEFGERPRGSILAKGLGYGQRETGKGPMEIYLLEEQK